MKAAKRIFSWTLHKLSFAALLIAFGLIGAALWTFNHEQGNFESQHRHAVLVLTTKDHQLRAAIADSDNRMTSTRAEIAAQQSRANQAAKVASNLEGINSGLNRLTGDSDQLDENDRRLIRMRQMETDARKRGVDLGKDLLRVQWEKDGMEIALERNQAELNAVSTDSSPWLYYGRKAWNSYGKAILAVTAIIMLSRTLWRFFSGR